MRSEAQFYSSFGAVVMLGPKSTSPVTPQQGVRRIYVKLVEAAVAYWHGVRGERAILDAEWSPRMGLFWSGIKRSCIHSTLEKAPLLFSDVYDLRRKGEASLGCLTQAVGGAGLASGGVGLG